MALRPGPQTLESIQALQHESVTHLAAVHLPADCPRLRVRWITGGDVCHTGEITDYIIHGLCAQVVLEHPPVLSYSPAERLAPFVEGLAGLGVREPLAIIVRRPSLLGLSLRENIQRIVSYLQEAGHSMEQIEEMLATTI